MAIAFIPDEKETLVPANDSRNIVTKLARVLQTPIAGGPGFEYQEPLVEAAVDAIRRGEREVLIAATPGAGKTVMAFEIARRLVETGDIDKALVMAWMRTALKKQWEDELDEKAPGLNAHVCIEIPQQGHNISGKFDLLIQDEGHQGYEVDDGMVSTIKSSVKAKTTLILTGSPSVFIKRGLKPTVVFSMEELHAAGRASDLTIEVGTSAYNILEDDFNGKGDVTEKGKKAQTQATTNATLDDLLKDLHKRIRLGSRDMARGVAGWWNRMQFGTAKKGWNAILDGLQKTIIACNDINQAEQVAKYMRAARVETLVSHGGNKRFPAPDKKSGNIDEFAKSTAPLLVVVDRAQLGYDNPELVNFIDMTGSRNPDRIFQMLCRVVRPSKKDPSMKKLFIKVMPESFASANLLFFMEGVLNLSRREIFETYDGTGIYKGPVPARQRKPKKTGGEGRGKSKEQDIVWSPVLEPGMSLFGPKGYFETIAGKPGEGYGAIGQVRLGEVLGKAVYDPDGAQDAYVQFFLDHGRWAKNAHDDSPESIISNRAMQYLYARYDAAFAARCRALGWKTKEEEIAANKDEIVKFVIERGKPRLNSQDPTERRLYVLLTNYTRDVPGGSYDPAFTAQLASLGILGRYAKAKKYKSDYLDFCRTNQCRPSSKSKDRTEATIAIRCTDFIRRDTSFSSEIARLGVPTAQEAKASQRRMSFIEHFKQTGTWPKGKDRSLLNAYTCPGSRIYNAAFRAKCAKLDPKRFGGGE